MRPIIRCSIIALVHVTLAAAAPPPDDTPEPYRVRGKMQAKPGGPLEDVEVGVHPSPVDLPTLTAEEAELADEELVLGLVADGQAMAFPIRYLALFEVVNSRVGKTPVAPTW